MGRMTQERRAATAGRPVTVGWAATPPPLNWAVIVRVGTGKQTSQQSIFKKPEGFKMVKIGGIFGGYQG